MVIRFQDQIKGLEYQLGSTAGENPVWDAKRSGIIMGLRAFLETDFEESA